jgi:hypothetical protein
LPRSVADLRPRKGRRGRIDKISDRLFVGKGGAAHGIFLTENGTVLVDTKLDGWVP